jgi:dTDP-4-amino-4,6-dideoxygalactose transaminase
MSQNTDFIPFAFPSLDSREEEAVLRVMRSGWLTTGTEALEFEKEFAAYVGSPRTLAVSSATAGLHLAYEAVGVGPGTRIVTSPYTFTATAEAARYLGAEVAFADVGDDGYNIDPSAVEAAVSSPGDRIASVVPVHIAGRPCDMTSILAIAKEAGAAVVEDAAHAFPVSTADGEGKRAFAGTIGDIGVYSFYANKTITTGEGGMVAVRDPVMAKRMSTMRLHGMDREAWDRYTAKRAAWRYAIVDAGYKYNMTDLAAAIGRVQLRKAADFLAKRQRIAAAYDSAFGGLDFITLRSPSSDDALYLYMIRIVPERLSIGRDEYIEELAARGIGTSVHFIPLHVMPYWSSRYGLKPGDFPKALSTFERTISLPIFPDMTDTQIERVIEAVAGIGKEKSLPRGRGLPESVGTVATGTVAGSSHGR